MKKLLLLPLLVLAGCGIVGEEEAPVPVLVLHAAPAACAFPEAVQVPGDVVQAVDCLQLTIDNAFSSLQGEQDKELSMAELKKLQEAGILKFAVGNPNEWHGLAGLLSLIHPKGKAAVSRDSLYRFFDWLRDNSVILAKLAHSKEHKGKYAPLEPNIFYELVELAEGFLPFISDLGTLTLEQAQALAALVQSNDVGSGKNVAAEISAFWTLKALLFEGTRAGDDVRGASLKAFLQMAITVARNTRATYAWWETDFHPADIPLTVESEWKLGLDAAKEYFRSRSMVDLSTDELIVPVRTLFPKSDLAVRIPDLVNAGRRLLAQNGVSHPGLVYGLLNVFNGVDQVAKALRTAAVEFAGCRKSADCSITLRTAIANESLNHVTRVSFSDWNPVMPWQAGQPLPKRLDGRVQWKVMFERFLERGVVANLFSAFDQNQDGMIPYVGETPEDIREATDVAYTLISLVNSADRPGANPSFYVKPSTLVDAMGLLGDAWVSPGNRDGKISLNEFYAALKIFDDITQVSSSSLVSLPQYSPKQEAAQARAVPLSDETVFYNRPEFIQNMGTIYQSQLPYLTPVFEELETRTKGSRLVLEALVPMQDKPFEVYRYGEGRMSRRLEQYLERKDTLRPVAVLVLLDRITQKCDTNEDERFNWQELDCVVPLMLDAGKALVRSDLFTLPLFVGDGSYIALDVLSQPGLPLNVMKTAVLNGSLREWHLKSSFTLDVFNKTVGNYQNIAPLLAPYSDKSKEALEEDLNNLVNYTVGGAASYVWGSKENTISGYTWWSIFTSNLLKEGILPSVSEKTKGILSTDRLFQLWQSIGTNPDPGLVRVRQLRRIVTLALALSVATPDWKRIIGEETTVSPANILSLLEGTLRPVGKITTRSSRGVVYELIEE